MAIASIDAWFDPVAVHGANSLWTIASRVITPPDSPVRMRLADPDDVAYPPLGPIGASRYEGATLFIDAPT